MNEEDVVAAAFAAALSTARWRKRVKLPTLSLRGGAVVGSNWKND